MLKNRIISLILLIILFSCKKNIKECIKEEFDNGNVKVIEKYDKNDSLIERVEFYDNKNTKLQELFNDSLRYTFFNENGEKIEAGVLSLDNKNGKRIRFKNGIIQVINYLNNGLINKTMRFYKNGKKRMEAKTSMINGYAIITEWYDNGVLSIKKDEFGNEVRYNEKGVPILKVLVNKAREDSVILHPNCP